ncbi:hypothetical protein [Nonomuraea rubra]|uniref:hypothetical protein n=1 Tax=Nonomuraea rubra TaxID=46180 RepID=UPI0031E54544
MLRSALIPLSSLLSPSSRSRPQRQLEACRPLIAQWLPLTTTQSSSLPVILARAPLPYALIVIGWAAVPRRPPA